MSCRKNWIAGARANGIAQAIWLLYPRRVVFWRLGGAGWKNRTRFRGNADAGSQTASQAGHGTKPLALPVGRFGFMRRQPRQQLRNDGTDAVPGGRLARTWLVDGSDHGEWDGFTVLSASSFPDGQQMGFR